MNPVGAIFAKFRLVPKFVHYFNAVHWAWVLFSIDVRQYLTSVFTHFSDFTFSIGSLVLLASRQDKSERLGVRYLHPSCCVFEQRHTYSQMSLSKTTFTPRKVLVIPRKRWIRPDMTGKLLTGTYIKHQHTQNNQQSGPVLQSIMVYFIWLNRGLQGYTHFCSKT